MSTTKRILTLAAMTGAFFSGEDLYMFPHHLPEKPFRKSKGLPKWKIGDFVVYAKNAKDAVKYAKKRGCYKEGTLAEIINDSN